MRLVWHIFKKDLRQDRWALGFWVGLFAVHFALANALLNSDGTDLEQIDLLRWGNLLITAFEFVIGYLLALRWVQADEVSGTRLFWVTRPIAGARMLAAKGLGVLAMFGLLPVLLWLPWWIVAGQGAREIVWLAAEVLGWQLLVIAPALLLGSLTNDFGRAIMWSLVLVIGVIAWSVMGQSPIAAPGNWTRPFTSLWFSRMWTAGVLLVLGFGAIAAGQFLARNSLRSLVRVGVLVLAVIGIGRFWTWDFADTFSRPGQPSPGEPVPGLAEKIAISVRDARVSSYQYRTRVADRLEDVRSLMITFDVSGLPDGLMLGGTHPFQELQWSGGPGIRSQERNFSFPNREELILRTRLSLPAPTGDPETVRWGSARVKKANEARAAKGLPLFEDNWPRQLQPPEPPSLGIRFAVPASVLARVREQPPAYVTAMEGLVSRWEILQVLPLSPGSRGTGLSRRLRVQNQDDWVTSLVETVPAYLRLGLFQSRVGVRRPNPERPVLYSVNQLTGDIDWVHGRSKVPSEIIVGGLEIKWTEATVRPAQWIRDEKWVTKDPEWVEHTQIVVMTAVEVGRFNREIRTDRLAVRFPPEAPKVNAAPEGSDAGDGN